MEVYEDPREIIEVVHNRNFQKMFKTESDFEVIRTKDMKKICMESR